MRAAVVLLAAAAGCAGPREPAPAAAVHPAATVWFEPPLPAPGTLTVVHESGFRWRGAASATGVTFSAPDGPCTLTLRSQGRTSERIWKLQAGSRELVWRPEPR